MMSHRIARLFLIATSAVALSGIARAAQAQGFISPFLGYDYGGDAGCASFSNCEDKKVNAGVSLGSMGPVFGFEEEFAYAKDFFGSAPGVSSSVLTVMSNAMLVPKIGPVRPYALAGLGLIKSNVDLSFASIGSFANNNFGWDVGGGLMILFGHVGVRGDIRYFHSFQDLDIGPVTLGNQKLDFGRASAALVFAF